LLSISAHHAEVAAHVPAPKAFNRGITQARSGTITPETSLTETHQGQTAKALSVLTANNEAAQVFNGRITAVMVTSK
jgi:hypothetical protein